MSEIPVWEASISHKQSSKMKKRGTFYMEEWPINLRAHYLESHLTSETAGVFLTPQKEGQHLMLCSTCSSIFFCIHPIQPRLDKAKWFWGGFSKHLKWLCWTKQELGFIKKTWVSRWMPWQGTGSHVAPWSGPSLLRKCQETAGKRMMNHVPLCPQHCLRAAPTVNYPQARQSHTW